mgnify:CR=1 FL=1
MKTFGDLNKETMAGPMSWSYWVGEVKELLVEVRALRWAGIREEWSDVACCGVLALLASGVPVGWVPLMPGFGLYAARKFEGRRVMWRRIFERHQLAFENRYLVNGGNFRKIHKVCAALALAGLEMHEVDLPWLRGEGICTE